MSRGKSGKNLKSSAGMDGQVDHEKNSHVRRFSRGGGSPRFLLVHSKTSEKPDVRGAALDAVLTLKGRV